MTQVNPEVADPIVWVAALGWPQATAQALLSACGTVVPPVSQTVVACYSDGFKAPQSVAVKASLSYCTSGP